MCAANWNVRFGPQADINPARSRANLLVGHGYTRVIGQHRSLQLGVLLTQLRRARRQRKNFLRVADAAQTIKAERHEPVAGIA